MKLRRFCENTWEVHELDDDEPCPGEISVFVGGHFGFGGPQSGGPVRHIPCGRTDHAPLEDQTLCGMCLNAGEFCVKKLDHEGAHASDVDIAAVLMGLKDG